MIRKFLHITLALYLVLLPEAGYSLPEGESVVSGDASFDRSTAGVLTITAGNNTIIDYSNFNIMSGESVIFIQPSASSAVLNNVIGSSSSEIAGTLSANGIIFLINPNGIHVAPSGVIEAQGLVLSTNVISRENFLNGQYTFDKLKDSSIVQEGSIRIHDAGFAAIISGRIHNTGLIQARLGTIALASGDKVTLSFGSNNRFSLAIDKEAASKMDFLKEAIRNDGTITATGGSVLIQAQAVKDLFFEVINNTGIIEANSIAEHDGRISLVSSGEFVNSGALDASSINDGVDGGEVIVHADTILQEGTIRANALDYAAAGYIELLGQSLSIYEDGSLVEARGLNALSIGGKVYINTLAGDTDYRLGALVDVSGGTLSGDAGMLEISAKGQLGYHGSIRGVAQEGYKGGSVLFDPYDIIIQAGGYDTVFGGDNTSASVADEASTEHAGDTLTFDPSANGSFYGFTNIYLQATHDITVNSDFNTATATGNAAVSLTLEADHDIIVNADITTTNANISLYADNDLTQGTTSDISAGSGTIYLYADYDKSGAGTLTRTAGSTITNSGALYLSSSSDLTTSALLTGATATGALYVYTYNDHSITIDSDISRVGKSLYFYSSGDLTQTADSDITATTGSIILCADESNTAVDSGRYNGIGTLTREAGSTITNSGALYFRSSSDLTTSMLLTGATVTGNLEVYTYNDHSITIDSDISRVGKTLYFYSSGDLIQTATSDLAATTGAIYLYADNSNTTADSGGYNGIGTLTREAGSTINNSGTLFLTSSSDLTTSALLTGATATGALYVYTYNDHSITIDSDISRVGKEIGFYSSGDLIQTATSDLAATSGWIYLCADNSSTTGDIGSYNGIGTLTREAGSTINNSGQLYLSSSSDLTTSALLTGATATGHLNVYTYNDHSITIDSDISRIGSYLGFYSSGDLIQTATCDLATTIGSIDLCADNSGTTADIGSYNGIGTLTREAGSTIDNSGALFFSSSSDLTTSALLTGATATGHFYIYTYNDHSITIDSDISRIAKEIGFYSSGDLIQTATCDLSTTTGSIILCADDSNTTADSDRNNGIGVVTQESGSTTTGGAIIVLGAESVTGISGSSVSVTSNASSLTLGEITSTGAVTVTSTGGSILDDGDSGTCLTGDLVSISGSSIGTSEAYLNTAATTLTLCTSSGDIYVAEEDAVTLNPISAHDGSVNLSFATAPTITSILGASGTGDNSVNIIVRTGDYDVSLGNARAEDAFGFSAAGGAITVSDAINTQGRDLTLSGDDIDITAAITTDAGDVSLIPNAGLSIGLATGSGDFSISDPEFDLISTSSTVNIGDSLSGDITVEGLTIGATNLALVSGGDILASSSATAISGSGDLSLTSGGVIGTSGMPFGVDIPSGDLSINASGQSGGVSAVISGSAASISYNSDAPGSVLLNGASLNRRSQPEVNERQSLLPALNSIYAIYRFMDDAERQGSDTAWPEDLSPDGSSKTSPLFQRFFSGAAPVNNDGIVEIIDTMKL